MRITLFLSRLSNGGAERQFVLLGENLAERGHEVSFVTLFPGGPHWDYSLKINRFAVIALYPENKKTSISLPFLIGGVRRFRQYLAKNPADVVYSALVTGNFIAQAAVPRRSGPKLVCGLRNSIVEGTWKKRAIANFSKLLSPKIDLAISNSQAGLDFHRKKGFRFQKSLLIPNGIDVNKFRPDNELRHQTRSALGFSKIDFVVTSVARLVQMKDHPTLMRAFQIAAQNEPRLRLFLVGNGSPQYTETLYALVKQLGIADKTVWWHDCEEPEKAYNASDLFCSSSCRGEGLSNSVAEALACNLSVIVTDVGDHRKLVGQYGQVIPPKDPKMLALAIEKSLNASPNEKPKTTSRGHIKKYYSIESMVQSTINAFHDILEKPHS
ncbi:MAG: glycosyltransferase [Opitutales bacterium]|nr:glycosyltransferase [Opitutales bacterium]